MVVVVVVVVSSEACHVPPEVIWAVAESGGRVVAAGQVGSLTPANCLRFAHPAEAHRKL